MRDGVVCSCSKLLLFCTSADKVPRSPASFFSDFLSSSTFHILVNPSTRYARTRPASCELLSPIGLASASLGSRLTTIPSPSGLPSQARANMSWSDRQVVARRGLHVPLILIRLPDRRDLPPSNGYVGMKSAVHSKWQQEQGCHRNWHRCHFVQRSTG
jgi:hypothetical protein